MATQLGRPAVNDPREFNLREVQQVVANIRERLRALDTVLASVQAVQVARADASVVDLNGIRRDIATLKQALAALQAQVDALESLDGGSDGDPRLEQIAGELVALQQQLQDPDPDPRVEQLAGELQAMQRQVDDPTPERLPQLEAQVGELTRQVDEIDPVGQTPVHAALLQKLQEQIDDLNLGVLL